MMLLISGYVIKYTLSFRRCYVLLELRETALMIDVFTFMSLASTSIFPLHFEFFSALHHS